MKYQINLSQTPNQALSCNAGAFALDINLRTSKAGLLYMDLQIDGVPEFYGRACIDRMPLLLNSKLGGNLYFEDIYGTENPEYQMLNDRFRLVYDEEYQI